MIARSHGIGQRMRWPSITTLTVFSFLLGFSITTTSRSIRSGRCGESAMAYREPFLNFGSSSSQVNRSSVALLDSFLLFIFIPFHVFEHGCIIHLTHLDSRCSSAVILSRFEAKVQLVFGLPRRGSILYQSFWGVVLVHHPLLPIDSILLATRIDIFSKKADGQAL